MSETPIALGLGGIGAMFLLSGIQNRSLSEILQGEFTHQGSSSSSGGGEGETPVVGKTDSASKSKILAAAATMIGVKYTYGGESEKNGFDCSGLTQWAYAQGGVKIPRTAQQQYDYTRRTTSPSPGDLVFFGSSPQNISHVGIVVGPGMMEDAPHTGAVIRYEHYPTTIGASWGSDKLIGYGTA